MKLTPKTPEEYLDITEHAVRHLYAGLASCRARAEGAYEHWDISKLGQPRTPEYEKGLKNFLRLMEEYFDLKFSEGTFAGSIFQVAYMGILYFSRNEEIPKSCAGIVPPQNKKAIRFCIGREVYGLPLGLIIYAARNQYSHWDDEKLHPVANNVFYYLSAAFHDNPIYDLAFEISNPTITIHANEILLGALRWTTYDKYLSEMRDLLCTT